MTKDTIVSWQIQGADGRGRGRVITDEQDGQVLVAVAYLDNGIILGYHPVICCAVTWLTEEDGAPSELIPFTVNGKEQTAAYTFITYEDVLALAGHQFSSTEQFAVRIVSYSLEGSQIDCGTLVPGARVKLKAGMVFTAKDENEN